MTREEAIDFMQGRIKLIDKYYPDIKDYRDALEMAIKALEQEPMFDKIRAEIKALCPEPTAEDVVDGNHTKDAIWETLDDVLQIIDKYKAESEE